MATPKSFLRLRTAKLIRHLGHRLGEHHGPKLWCLLMSVYTYQYEVALLN